MQHRAENVMDTSHVVTERPQLRCQELAGDYLDP